MPRERFGPAELLGRLEGTQPHNERASRCPREMPRGPARMPSGWAARCPGRVGAVEPRRIGVPELLNLLLELSL